MIDSYRSQHSGFEATIELRDDLPAGLMVSGPRLLISRSTNMARRRVEALLSHEIGVHLLTYFNGSAQGLRLFRSGLAGYEGVQEGLAVFAEYLVGGMTIGRLRLIAARVVACAAMLEGASFQETFLVLVRDYGFTEAGAFNLTLGSIVEAASQKTRSICAASWRCSTISEKAERSIRSGWERSPPRISVSCRN